MKSKEILLKIYLIIFRINYIISSLLGLAPCSIKIVNRSAQRIDLTLIFSYSRVGCAYNIVLIMLCVVIIVIGVPLLEEMQYPNDSKTLKTITITLSTMGNIGAIVIISTHAILQRRIIKIGNQLHEFDRKYGDKLIGRRANAFRDFRRMMPIIFLFFIWTGLLVTTGIAEEEVYILNSSVWASCFSWFLTQYSLVILVLRGRFEGINNALLATAKYPIGFEENSLFRGSVTNDRLIIKNLSIMKQARKEIHKITREVSRFYSFPVLIIISYCCCCSVNSMYYCVLTLIDPEVDVFTNIIIIDSIFWTLITLYPIVMLSTSVDAFHEEVCKTADIVYDIMETYAPNKDIESELNNFAIELLHRRVVFNACGMFSLDCTLLHSIFGMIVTYLLILLQFKPAGSDSKN
ncbi:uncharacterized protein LOC114841477 [Diachasma alloeum]|uniref:Gustatory receptor n=1 Tax=Diachasma alloeum TaxID=454923 RepID=A0A4E0S191_9HYME|nr:uncharacterized protein LOC114841477 [Diachasma alloeum]THK33170.1 gustatory receptor 25 [Diachasma alloeum]